MSAVDLKTNGNRLVDKDLYNSKIILFYDGVCNLCNGFVLFALDRNSKENIYFSSLQSNFALHILPMKISTQMESNPEMASLVVSKYGKLYYRSAAVFELVKELDGLVRFLLVFRYFPRRLNDLFYRFIARNRYSLFGRESICRIPTPEIKHRFLED